MVASRLCTVAPAAAPAPHESPCNNCLHAGFETDQQHLVALRWLIAAMRSALERCQALHACSICRDVPDASSLHVGHLYKARQQQLRYIAVVHSSSALMSLRKLLLQTEKQKVFDNVPKPARQNFAKSTCSQAAAILRQAPDCTVFRAHLHHPLLIPAWTSCRRPRRAKRWAPRRSAQSSPTWCCPRRWTRRGARPAWVIL